MWITLISLYGTASAVFYKPDKKSQTPLNPDHKFDFGTGEVGCTCAFGKYDKLCECCHTRNKCQDQGKGECKWTSKMPMSILSKPCKATTPPMVYDVEVADPTTHGCNCLFKSDDSPLRRQCKCCLERNSCNEKKACAWDKAAWKFSFKACQNRVVIETNGVADLKTARAHSPFVSLMTIFYLL